jgi:alkanesulfonate monooxygenase
MPINVLGMIGVTPSQGSTVHIIGGGIDRDFLRGFARSHETAGFDAVLVGYTSSAAEGFAVAQYCAHHTERLKFLVAHRPGFVEPTLAARTVATFDALTEGRLWLHVITGGHDAEQRRDGDWLGHDERYARTDEYLEVMRRVWTEDRPFDHAGVYYRYAKAYSEVRCLQQPHVPIWFGGVSEPALAVGARHCDTYALFGEPRGAIAALIDRISAAARQHGRRPRFNVSFRPIVADTEDAAWAQARRILAEVERQSGGKRISPEAENARRLVGLREQGDVHDERLWVPIASATGGSGNTTALVGTPAQVAEAIARYYDLGVSGVLLRGFDPVADTERFGRELIPELRACVAARDAAGAAATAPAS